MYIAPDGVAGADSIAMRIPFASSFIFAFGAISPLVEVSSLLAEMVQHGLRCIAFCNTRKSVELVHNHT